MSLAYMIFDSQQKAETACQLISDAMGLGKPGMTTTRWNDVRQRADGKYVLLWPGNEWLRTQEEQPVIEVESPDWWELPALEPMEPFA